MAIFAIYHKFDVEEEFGDLHTEKELLGFVSDEKSAKEFVEKYNRPITVGYNFNDSPIVEHRVFYEEMSEMDTSVCPFNNYYKFENTIYIGLFIEDCNGLEKTLPRGINRQHVTLAFKPTREQFDSFVPFFDGLFYVNVIGYGNNGKNEGYLVEIPPEIPYYGQTKKHITVGLANGAKPVDTGSIEFKPIKHRLVVCRLLTQTK